MEFTEEQFSKSERNGLSLLTDDDLLIYSVGISTGGIAEMKMARANPRRKIIATTIDNEGAMHAKELINRYNLSAQIEVRLENVVNSLPYDESFFDFIYARLVLHWLSRQELETALAGLDRVLKPNKKMFVVVRSNLCEEVSWPDSEYDPITGLTWVTYKNGDTQTRTKRFFHSEKSISEYLSKAGFKIESLKSYTEQLFKDFERKIPSPKLDQLIEVIATK